MPDSVQNPTPVMPPPPVQKDNQSQGSNNSPRNTLLLIGSIFVFVTIVGITLYLILQNQNAQSGLIAQNTEENSEGQNIPVSPLPSMPEEEKLEKYGVVCKRFTSIEEALQEIEIACILDLSKNELDSIDSKITELVNLREVNISDNNFNDVPETLLEMKSVRVIDISENNIDKDTIDTLKAKYPNVVFHF